jgi:hypothetical protein
MQPYPNRPSLGKCAAARSPAKIIDFREARRASMELSAEAIADLPDLPVADCGGFASLAAIVPASMPASDTEGATANADHATKAPPHVREALDASPAAHATNERREPFTQIPANLLGLVLDQGKPSMYAAHLLAIKLSKGPGHVLNETLVGKKVEKGGYAIGRRSFQAGLATLKKAGVFERKQQGRKTFALEKIIAKGGGNYVALRDALLKQRSSLVAFCLVVNMSPAPHRPEHFARRIGVRSAPTIRALVKDAVALGEVTLDIGSRGTVMVARRGYKFDPVKNVPAKNVPAKNVPAHSTMEEGTVNGRDPQYAAQAYVRPARCAASRQHDQDDKIIEAARDCEQPITDARLMTLHDWKKCRYVAEHGLCGGDKAHDALTWPEWRGWLDWYGGAPAHLATPAAYQQAMEMAHELNALNGNVVPRKFVAIAVAFEICRAHAQGKVIRSLGFVFEGLVGRACSSDTLWAYGLPVRMDMPQFEEAYKLAREAVTACGDHGLRVDEECLLSAPAVEILAGMISQHGRSAVVAGINFALGGGQRLPEGHVACCWSWFKDAMFKASPVGRRLHHGAGGLRKAREARRGQG